MVLDRIEQLEAKLQKLLSVPAIAEAIAEHEKAMEQAHAEAQERIAAENQEQAQEQTDEAPEDGGQAQA